MSDILSSSSLNVYKYEENSCYLDTLLLILFGNVSTKWLNAMILKSYKASDFTPLICKNKLSIEETVRYAGKLRTVLSDEYNKIHGSKSDYLKCVNVRSLLFECIPSMRERGKYIPYNVAEIYNLFANLYPNLNIEIDYVIKENGMVVSTNTMSLPSFTTWEFMEEIINGKEYLWDTVTSSILVFQNTGVPAITELNSLESEKSVVTIDKTTMIGTVEKKRYFSVTILNERYRLVGAIILQGYTLGKEGGIHYVGYFLGSDYKYYYYNDIGPKVVQIDKLPDSVWNYVGGNMPVMYFYAKTSS